MQVLKRLKGSFSHGINSIPGSDSFLFSQLPKVRCANCGALIDRTTSNHSTLHGHHNYGGLESPTEKNAWYKELYCCHSFDPKTKLCSPSKEEGASRLTYEKLFGRILA